MLSSNVACGIEFAMPSKAPVGVCLRFSLFGPDHDHGFPRDATNTAISASDLHGVGGNSELLRHQRAAGHWTWVSSFSHPFCWATLVLKGNRTLVFSGIVITPCNTRAGSSARETELPANLTQKSVPYGNEHKLLL